MKKILLITLLTLTVNTVFSQDALIRVEGDFYEGNLLLKNDSMIMKNLIDSFNIDLGSYKFLKVCDSTSTELFKKSSRISYAVVVDKNDNSIKVTKTEFKNRLPMSNKYIMYFCFDSYYDKKKINVVIF